jgi:penicillin-binding protein 2
VNDELLEALRTARPAFPLEMLSADGAPAHTVLERVLSTRRRRRPGWAWRGAPLALTVGATVLVAAVAILTLRGHRPATPRAVIGASSLDASLERTAQRSLQHAIEANRPASGGAFVALDPDTGQVYAIGSVHGGALVHATRSAGSVGSTFTPITALAALESGAWALGSTFDDPGHFCIHGQCRLNPGGAVYGALDLENALKVSSNNFFYNLGALTNSSQPSGGAIQKWARALGIATVPTPAWLARHGIGRPWSTGDNLSLAVGQGDVQVTPLQLAVAYAAIANSGTVVRPHLRRTITSTPVRRLAIDGRYLAAIRAGLRAATSQPGGNAADVFSGFPVPVYGETGSAQNPGQQDDAWFAGFVPVTATSRPIVVVVTVGQGGFGARAAAPVARQILSQWFLGRPGPWVPGAAHTR